MDVKTDRADTVWRRGRFDARSGPGKVLFGRMYEDSAIERAAFAPGGRVFCIASAGCTAMALAPDHEVVAVDINPVQVAYAEQRFAGDPGMRGAAEKVMGFGRTFAPAMGWWPSRLATFLDMDDPAAQTAYWQRYLDTRRFRIAFDGLMSLTSLRAVYAAPFLDFLPRRFGAVMRGRMARCFARHPNRSNPYARRLLTGEWNEDPPPPEARGIELVCLDAAEYLENAPAGSFSGVSLSNILDGAKAGYRERLFDAVRHAAAPEAVVVLRSFREPAQATPTNRAAEDRSILWGLVEVIPAEDLPNHAAPQTGDPPE